MNQKYEELIDKFIQNYGQKIYSFIVYLIGGDQNKAYDICVNSFVEIFNSANIRDERDLFIRLIRDAIEKCVNIKTIPSKEVLNTIDEVFRFEIKIFSIIFEALLKIDFKERAFLILRYQLNLTYKEISKILNVSSSQVRHELINSLEKLDRIIKQM
ncbi:MAG: sigma factor-like helix-turn-helix DNA-binding protein [Candidatus Aenigmatarchaeota archaeon]